MWNPTAVEVFRRTVAEYSMGVGERADVDRAYGAAVRECEQAIRAARVRLAEVRELRNHACQWNDDDRCVVCGADGRA